MRDEDLVIDIMEAYRSFHDDRIFFYDEEAESEVFICEDDTAKVLSRVEHFVNRSATTTASGFIIKDGKVKNSSLSCYFYDVDVLIAAFDPQKKYTPNVDVFFMAMMKLDWQRRRPSQEYRASLDNRILIEFNCLIDLIREQVKSKEFKERVSCANRKLRDNYNTCKRKIDAGFMDYPRLLVLRVDLSFRKHLSLKNAKKFFNKFLNNRRSNNIFKHEVGYIWSLEHGYDKGYHYHCFFFFDGAFVQKDAYRANLIGEYWMETSERIGIFHNCNSHKEDYKYLAIGKIENFDLVTRKNLLDTLSYLFKKDQVLSIRYDGSVVRTFACGFKPKPRLSNAGRPRKIFDTNK